MSSAERDVQRVGVGGGVPGDDPERVLAGAQAVVVERLRRRRGGGGRGHRVDAVGGDLLLALVEVQVEVVGRDHPGEGGLDVEGAVGLGDGEVVLVAGARVGAAGGAVHEVEGVGAHGDVALEVEGRGGGGVAGGHGWRVRGGGGLVLG